ncbi:MAG: energy-coupling factor transporter transmembrane protein EcfT [Candidatus Ancillula sp.]|nr:energy-coupling factor transporter transmembrane protein EcfT [Candidatus Ancillula sp.]
MPLIKHVKVVVAFLPVILLTGLIQYLLSGLIQDCIFVMLRFLAIVVFSRFLVHYINPWRVAKLIKNDKISLIVALSLRFVIIFQHTFYAIRMGARIRSIKSRFGVKLIPALFLQTISKANTMAYILKIRGYSEDVARTHFKLTINLDK